MLRENGAAAAATAAVAMLAVAGAVATAAGSNDFRSGDAPAFAASRLGISLGRANSGAGRSVCEASEQWHCRGGAISATLGALVGRRLRFQRGLVGVGKNSRKNITDYITLLIITTINYYYYDCYCCYTYQVT